MAARKSVDDKLDELEAAVERAGADALPAVLALALGERSYRVVALAAHFAGQRRVYECVPQLLAAWPQFLEKPAKRDPNCLAKKAIVRALYDLDCDDVDFYLTAIRYRQMEPVWGGSVDTAIDVRCSAAVGLVSSGYSRALIELAGLLADAEPPVRTGAARAVACGSPREAELLLRLKALSGDEDALVLGECFTGLLSVEPDESPAFVARFLEDGNDAVVEAAALALGESRLPAALAFLQAAWEGVLVPAERRRLLVRAAALHRSDEAFDWLLGLAAESSAAIASEIVDVLAIYRHNEKLAGRLREIVNDRADEDSKSMFDSLWG
ncbi:MAG TPA: hypothetical protein VMR74_16865 [Gammaproteobacteria bacterium]|nr:hypothetical protein [Gammaproteobacteria bacterium]